MKKNNTKADRSSQANNSNQGENLSLDNKRDSLKEALTAIFCDDDAIRNCKSALMKAICQVLGDRNDNDPFFVANKKTQEQFSFSLHSLYEFLDILEQAGICSIKDLNEIIIIKEGRV